MSKMVRFGISANPRLMESFDRVIAEKGYLNRSEAIRGLIRDQLGEIRSAGGGAMIGTITIVYGCNCGERIAGKVNGLRHPRLNQVISSLHATLDEHRCLDVLVIKATAEKLKSISNGFLVTRGVEQVTLSMSTAVPES